MILFSNEKELLEAVRTGIPDAYEHLFKTYFPRLHNFARRFVTDTEAASDIVQECYMQLWEHRHSAEIASLKSYLYTMVRNRCLNELKHRMVVSGFEQHTIKANTGSEALYAMGFTGRADGPLLLYELKQQVDEIMLLLPERTREVFAKSRFEGKKNREIAEELGISEKVVEKHITKALRIFGSKMPRPTMYMLGLLF